MARKNESDVWQTLLRYLLLLLLIVVLSTSITIKISSKCPNPKDKDCIMDIIFTFEPVVKDLTAIIARIVKF